MTVIYQTAQILIQRAYRDAGLMQEGDIPTASQYSDALTTLNDIANLWQTQGLKLWMIQDLAVPLVAGQGTYTLGITGDVVMDKPLRVIQAYNLDNTNIRRPLVPLSREEWTRLSQVTQQGQINSYFVDKQLNLLIIHFWLIPDSVAATSIAHLVTQTQIPNFTSITDTMQFPPEWAIALRWALADELATGQPQPIMDRCERKALQYRTMLEDWDVEDAPTQFTPDQRNLYRGFNFR